jgi:ABC-type transport system involved in multi-copper enzyme maturation permease subunit
LFLFIIAVLMMVLDILQANKLFFNKQDIDQLIKRPISNAQIVWSKLAFLFVTHYFMTALLVFPIMISYGQIIGKPAIFYYQGLFYRNHQRPVFLFYLFLTSHQGCLRQYL